MVFFLSVEALQMGNLDLLFKHVNYSAMQSSNMLSLNQRISYPLISTEKEDKLQCRAPSFAYSNHVLLTMDEDKEFYTKAYPLSL